MDWFERIRMKSKIKWVALAGLVLSFASIMLHMFLAKSSSFVQYSAITAFAEDVNHIDAAVGKVREVVRFW